MDGVRRCHASAMRRVREFQVRDTSPVEEIVIFSGIDEIDCVERHDSADPLEVLRPHKTRSGYFFESLRRNINPPKEA